jgi:hypothetical protein
LAFTAGASDVSAADLSPEALDSIHRRIDPIQPYTRKLSVPRGHTVFLTAEVPILAAQNQQNPDAYEAVVTGGVTPKGVSVGPLADSWLMPPRGESGKVRIVYLISTDPEAKRGGVVQLTLSIVERRGLGSALASTKIRHSLSVTPAGGSPDDLAADFFAYRYHRLAAVSAATELSRQNITNLSLSGKDTLPALGRLDTQTSATLLDFGRSRRRMWVAERHLVAAKLAGKPDIARLAETYLANLKTPSEELNVPRPPPFGDSTPVAASPPPLPAAKTSGGPKEMLAPVKTYQPGTPGSSEDLIAAPAQSPPEQSDKDVVQPDENLNPESTSEADEEDTEEELVEMVPYLFGQREQRVRIIPSYYRFLSLDDPNIGHGAWFRTAWSSVDLRETAQVGAFFFSGQVAVTDSFGIEFTVPTELVSLDLERSQSVFAMGNPLLTAKYRFHLPKILGRRPAISIRGRWGMPLSTKSAIPPTDLEAETFSREAFFTEPWAFNLEKSNLGLGTLAVWAYGILQVGFQFSADYLFPVGDTKDQLDFLSLNYAASVGVLPFGDIAGFFGEGRATSILSGGGRTEGLLVLGARSRIFDRFEPALWAGFPLGSTADTNSVQFNLEIRVHFDVPARLSEPKNDGPNLGLPE